MKPKYNNKYKKNYNFLQTWNRKQITTKVRKYFMQPDEFLGIYNLYMNIKTKEDYLFVINMIETSKTYKHYKTNPIYFRTNTLGSDLIEPGSLQYVMHQIKASLNAMRPGFLLFPIIEWLYSHTIHTSSLSSVTFK